MLATFSTGGNKVHNLYKRTSKVYFAESFQNRLADSRMPWHWNPLNKYTNYVA